MELIAVVVAYLLGGFVGYILAAKEIRIHFTKHHTYEHQDVVELSNEEAEKELSEQDVLQSAQHYLDQYLSQED